MCIVNSKIIDSVVKELEIDDIRSASIRQIGAVVRAVEARTGVEFIHFEMGVPGLQPSAVGVKAECEALQRGVAALRRPLSLTTYVSASGSTNTGVSLLLVIASTEAMNVFAGTSTSSPSFNMPIAMYPLNISHKASYPLPQPMQWRLPVYVAYSFSKAAHSSPSKNHPRCTILVSASVISGSYEAVISLSGRYFIIALSCNRGIL